MEMFGTGYGLIAVLVVIVIALWYSIYKDHNVINLTDELTETESRIYDLKMDLMKAEQTVHDLKLEIGILTSENIN
ncbi:MAG: hypothetical protein ACR2PR_12005 [Pseudohongiellaceae bacterium]